MFEIRCMTSSDLDFAVKITHAEGWGYTKEDFMRLLKWTPDGCYVVWSEGRRTGMATTVFYGTFGWVGNVVVDRDHRGRGMGLSLIKRCISDILDKGGMGVRLFAYTNTRAFYEEMGFRHEGQVGVFRRAVAPVKAAPVPAGIEVRRLGPGDHAEAIALDKAILGGDRGRVLRSMWEVNPDLSFGLWKDGRMRGFAVGKKVLGNIEVGPWLCDLPDKGPAIVLLEAIMGADRTDVFLGVPMAQGVTVKALQYHGFVKVDTVHGMALHRPPPMDTDSILAVGALEKG